MIIRKKTLILYSHIERNFHYMKTIRNNKMLMIKKNISKTIFFH